VSRKPVWPGSDTDADRFVLVLSPFVAQAEAVSAALRLQLTATRRAFEATALFFRVAHDREAEADAKAAKAAAAASLKSAKESAAKASAAKASAAKASSAPAGAAFEPAGPFEFLGLVSGFLADLADARAANAVNAAKVAGVVRRAAQEASTAEARRRRAKISREASSGGGGGGRGDGGGGGGGSAVAVAAEAGDEQPKRRWFDGRGGSRGSPGSGAGKSVSMAALRAGKSEMEMMVEKRRSRAAASAPADSPRAARLTAAAALVAEEAWVPPVALPVDTVPDAAADVTVGYVDSVEDAAPGALPGSAAAGGDRSECATGLSNRLTTFVSGLREKGAPKAVGNAGSKEAGKVDWRLQPSGFTIVASGGDRMPELTSRGAGKRHRKRRQCRGDHRPGIKGADAVAGTVARTTVTAESGDGAVETVDGSVDGWADDSVDSWVEAGGLRVSSAAVALWGRLGSGHGPTWLLLADAPKNPRRPRGDPSVPAVALVGCGAGGLAALRVALGKVTTGAGGFAVAATDGCGSVRVKRVFVLFASPLASARGRAAAAQSKGGLLGVMPAHLVLEVGANMTRLH